MIHFIIQGNIDDYRATLHKASYRAYHCVQIAPNVYIGAHDGHISTKCMLRELPGCHVLPAAPNPLPSAALSCVSCFTLPSNPIVRDLLTQVHAKYGGEHFNPDNF